MTMLRRKRDTSHTARYGTDDFAARLAAREAALGLHAAASTSANVLVATQANRATCDTVPDAVPAEPGEAAALPGYDRWGNEIVRGHEDEAHVIRSQYDGRLIPVCGEYRTGKHVVWWVFDEELMRPVCSFCFTGQLKGW